MPFHLVQLRNIWCSYKVERHGAKARAIAGKRSEIVEQRKRQYGRVQEECVSRKVTRKEGMKMKKGR